MEAALLANANGGGESVHRGMLVGALLGCAHGSSKMPKHLKKGLVNSVVIEREINAFVASVCGSARNRKRGVGRNVDNQKQNITTARIASSEVCAVVRSDLVMKSIEARQANSQLAIEKKQAGAQAESELARIDKELELPPSGPPATRHVLLMIPRT